MPIDTSCLSYVLHYMYLLTYKSYWLHDPWFSRPTLAGTRCMALNCSVIHEMSF